MMARRLVLAGVCLAVLIAAVAIILDQMAGRPGPSAAPTTSTSSPRADSSAAASGGATPGADAPSGSAASGSPASGSPTSGTEGSGSGNSSEGNSGDGGPAAAKPLEVLPPVTATPTGLPAPSAPAPLITGSLPQPGSASGEVVDGWPAGVLTLPEGTTIGSTSVSTSGDVLQVAADGIIAKPQAEVLASFRQSLVAHGFWSEAAPAADGAMAERFVRGTDTVTVSVSTTGTGTSRFQLLGSLRAAAD
ncbi:hypothetical protein CQ020_02605 [Arthrobacter sp. MYb23]|uniref:hypothetical protein n=1 Tax=unclassified Arthrobacter TaxID=235627 RepID=UPI000CFD7283|nr:MULTISPECIES: hypothetical protein [unclassified Arthrobacter]PRB40435.1 hypothetical protein CQ038_17040 [Arthrobacter sp. MYb51]PRB98374.1 hypothetical protein CQ020_02605 [Arthrobacter sp. MYb23]